VTSVTPPSDFFDNQIFGMIPQSANEVYKYHRFIFPYLSAELISAKAFPDAIRYMIPVAPIIFIWAVEACFAVQGWLRMRPGIGVYLAGVLVLVWPLYRTVVLVNDMNSERI
jgi:hypothetical protein